MLLDQFAQRDLGTVKLIELELDHRLARRQPRVGGSLGEPLIQRLQGRLILAVFHKPLRTLGV